jgi:hypothetical protein
MFHLGGRPRGAVPFYTGRYLIDMGDFPKVTALLEVKKTPFRDEGQPGIQERTAVEE